MQKGTSEQTVGNQDTFSSLSRNTINRVVVGRKRAFESLAESPIEPGPKLNFPTESGLGIFVESGPKEKKLNTNTTESLGPLIRIEAFPNSPFSLHMKLKELARKKGSPSTLHLPATETEPCNVNKKKTQGNNLMAEEAGLITPPN